MVEIVWSTKATSDLKEIIEFWNSNNKSTTYSKKLILLIQNKLEQISENPLSGITTDLDNIRSILFENYYLHYSFTSNKILILRIWDVRQNPLNFEL
ncbi:type II toxin-antitoxin system RelE/ParE family toxin [Epilithonimonas sp. UC225_85]|uniref:type II toxin-antitoxin system RelE/ParE family toxin n=1 Tax=Epilithonimonas sp. UC225_85 TaxID=3350167 RepID=UPI0036D22D32